MISLGGLGAGAVRRRLGRFGCIGGGGGYKKCLHAWGAGVGSAAAGGLGRLWRRRRLAPHLSQQLGRLGAWAGAALGGARRERLGAWAGAALGGTRRERLGAGGLGSLPGARASGGAGWLGCARVGLVPSAGRRVCSPCVLVRRLGVLRQSRAPRAAALRARRSAPPPPRRRAQPLRARPAPQPPPPHCAPLQAAPASSPSRRARPRKAAPAPSPQPPPTRAPQGSPSPSPQPPPPHSPPRQPQPKPPAAQPSSRPS